MSTSSTHNINVVVTTTGLDTTATHLKTVTTNTKTAQGSFDALGTTFQKTGAIQTKVSSGFAEMGNTATQTASKTNTYGKAVDSAGQKTQGFAAKFQGNKGAIFAFVGMASAGMEAVGMFGMYQSAADKVAQAQELVNKLEQSGAQDTTDYKNAVNDLADAKRGFNFILRNVAMSFGDLVPFTLLAINAIMKMRETVAGSKTAIDAATQSNVALGNSAKTAAASGITPLFNSAGQLTGGMTNLGTSARNAATTGITPLFNSAGQLIGSTDELFVSSGRSATNLDKVGVSARDTSKFVGSKGSGLVSGVSALDLVMSKSQSTGTKFSQVFSQIGTSVKSLPGVFTSIGSSIAGFFTNFAGNMGKFGTILKTAGTAAMAFSKTLLLAFMSNPITAAIALISAAVLALITDFMGFRTAINQVGVAIGNAIPPLKGVLTYLGEAGNGALDAAASFLGMETQAQKMAKQAQALAGVLEDDLVQALQQTVDIGSKLENLDKVVSQFDKLRAEIDKVTVSSTAWSGTSVKNINVFADAFEVAMSMIPNKSVEAQNAINGLRNIITELGKGTKGTEETQKMLHQALTQVLNVIYEDVKATKEDITAKEKQGKTNTVVQNATLGMSDAVKSFVAQLQISNATGKQHQTVIDDQAKALLDWTQSMGITIDTTNGVSESVKNWADAMMPLGPALKEMGADIVYTDEAGINWTKTLENMGAKQKEVTTLGTQLFNSMKVAVQNVGAEAFPIIEAALDKLKGVYPEVFAVAQKLWEEEKNRMMENGQFTEELGELKKKKTKETTTLQEQYNKKLQEESEELAFNAQQLGINVKQVQLSNEALKVAVKFRQDEKKSFDDSRAGLQELALQRGLDISLLDQSNGFLLDHIKNNKLAAISEDEITFALGELIAAREEDARASALQGAVAREWISGMEEAIPVTKMTGEGLMRLAETYADVKNATSIAADEIGLWYAELQKGEAIEQASIEKMLELAKGIGVEIPSSIQDSVPDMQTYVQQILRIGDAAKKMKDDALAAFDELRNKAKSGLEKIFSDALGEDGDNVKKALKGIDKVGMGIDSLNAKQIVIDAFLNDTNYTNKVESLSEIMEKEYGDIATLSQSQGFDVGDTFATSLRDAVGAKGQPVADTVDTIWAKVKASAKPGETGNELIGRFSEALKKAGVVEAAIKAGATDPVLAELGLIPPQAAKTGNEVSSKLGGALKAGANTVGNEAAAGLKDPIVQNASLIPGETGTAVAPVEGVFSDAFLKANVAATGQISMLLRDITLSMGYLLTNIQTSLTGIEGLWVTHATNIGIYVENIKIQVVTLQQTLSDLSTNTLTYTTSMNANLSNWGVVAITAFSNVSENVLITQGVLSTFSTSVATYMSSMTTNIGNWGIAAITALSNVAKNVLVTQGVFSTMSTSIKTYMSSMTTNIANFAKSATTSFDTAGKGAFGFQGKSSTLSTTVATHMRSMTTNVGNFASAAVKSFNSVGSAADANAKKVAALRKEIDALKSKTITITVNYKVNKPKGMQHGGAFIASKATSIDGVNIAEHNKPELVSVLPLTNPNQNSDQTIDIPMPNIKSPQIKMPTQQMMNGGSGQPIVVNGNLFVEVQLNDGSTIAKAVKPYLLEGYSGISSS